MKKETQKTTKEPNIIKPQISEMSSPIKKKNKKQNAKEYKLIVKREEKRIERERLAIEKKLRGKGRPSVYTVELAERICSEIASGRSLRSICMQKEFPSMETVFSFMRKYPYFLVNYTNAQAERTEAQAEEILEIADNIESDSIDIIGPNGIIIGQRENKEWVNRSRLRIETRKWLMSKMKPKKYGDKIDFTSNGEKITGFNFLPTTPLEDSNVKYIDLDLVVQEDHKSTDKSNNDKSIG